MSIEDLQRDVEFLLTRADKAGYCSLGGDERDHGISSNSIVAIAYGAKPLDQQEMPGDKWDLKACEKMWEKLPDHRKTADALKAIQRAVAAVEASHSIAARQEGGVR